MDSYHNPRPQRASYNLRYGTNVRTYDFWSDLSGMTETDDSESGLARGQISEGIDYSLDGVPLAELKRRMIREDSHSALN